MASLELLIWRQAVVIITCLNTIVSLALVDLLSYSDMCLL